MFNTCTSKFVPLSLFLKFSKMDITFESSIFVHQIISLSDKIILTHSLNCGLANSWKGIDPFSQHGKLYMTLKDMCLAENVQRSNSVDVMHYKNLHYLFKQHVSSFNTRNRRQITSSRSDLVGLTLIINGR